MHRQLMRVSLMILAAAGVASADACGGSRAAGAAFTTRDSSGVTIVESRRPLRDSAWRLTPAPVTRIGSVAGDDPAQQFTSVQHARRLSDGRVVVVDDEGVELRWFDASGHHLRTVTRRGSGPGEFRYVSALWRLPGDSVALQGGTGIKEAIFTPDGDYVREEALDYLRFRAMGHFGECGGPPLPDRSLLVCMELPGATPLPPDPGPGYLRHMMRFVRVPWTLDSMVPLGLDGGIEQYGVDLGQKWTNFVVHPFHSRSLTAAGGTPMRIAIVTNPEYSVEVWRPDGTLERILRRPDGRRAPTSAERSAADSELRAREMRGPNADPVLADKVVSAVPVPELLPAAVDLAVAPGGEVLVMREGWLVPQQASLVDVFDAEGRWLCTLRLPPRFRMLDVGDDYLLGVRYDESDVPFVEVYGLSKVG